LDCVFSLCFSGYLLTFCFLKPVSEKTKEYILNLDIEGDAQLLQERLNIGRAATDYFCASSSILKAGIKAGLTLYDIAVMCCRNDNLGELPSKLEVLFSMAADLAESAIENGRWHHSAASRALAEQLTPNAGSLLNSRPGTLRIRKSASALSMSQYTPGLDGFDMPLKQELMPGMIHSSASDSSSETGEVEREDCEEWDAEVIADVSTEKSFSLIKSRKGRSSDSSSDTGEVEREDCDEWAAEVIADVSMEKRFSLFKSRKGRSLSIESDGSNDSISPKGFWHTHPDDDDASWASWESLEESEHEILMQATRDKRERRMSSTISYNPFEKVVDPLQEHGYDPFDNVVDPLQEHGDSVFHEVRSPTKVTFDATATKTDGTPDARFKHSNSDVGESVTFMQRNEGGGLKRSQSYSGLSSVSQKISNDEDVAASKVSRPDNEDQRREYFLSFVDLVIVRETTAAARLANQG
jgi:hypothetical protein